YSHAGKITATNKQAHGGQTPWACIFISRFAVCRLGCLFPLTSSFEWPSASLARRRMPGRPTRLLLSCAHWLLAPWASILSPASPCPLSSPSLLRLFLWLASAVRQRLRFWGRQPWPSPCP